MTGQSRKWSKSSKPSKKRLQKLVQQLSEVANEERKSWRKKEEIEKEKLIPCVYWHEGKQAALQPPATFTIFLAGFCDQELKHVAATVASAAE